MNIKHLFTIIILLSLASCTQSGNYKTIKSNNSDLESAKQHIIIGANYLHGNKVEKNFKRAYEEFIKAGKKGDARGYLFTGFMNSVITYDMRDKELLEKNFTLASKLGSLEALYNLGVYRLQRDIFNPNPKTLNQAAKQKYLYAQIPYAFNFVRSGNYEKALRILNEVKEKEAKHGNAAIGALYRDKGNHEKATSHLILASTQGSVIAPLILGKNYLCKNGVKYNKSEAKRYRKIAVTNGAIKRDLEMIDESMKKCSRSFDGDNKGFLFTYSAKDAVRDYFTRNRYSFGNIGKLLDNKIK